MDPRWRSGRLLARVLAFVALAAAAIAIVVVVAGSIDGKDDDKKGKGDSAKVEGCSPEDKDAVFYIVQEDDLLSVIAQRTCVTVEELQQLNPETDPQALTPGTCLKLELGGCERAAQ